MLMLLVFIENIMYELYGTSFMSVVALRNAFICNFDDNVFWVIYSPYRVE